jgi:hypothetical protein
MKKIILSAAALLLISSLHAQTCERAIKDMNHYFEQVSQKYQTYHNAIAIAPQNNREVQEKSLKNWYEKQLHFCIEQIKIIEKICPTKPIFISGSDEKIKDSLKDANKEVQFEIPDTPMGWSAN